MTRQQGVRGVAQAGGALFGTGAGDTLDGMVADNALKSTEVHVDAALADIEAGGALEGIQLLVGVMLDVVVADGALADKFLFLGWYVLHHLCC